MTRLWYDHFPRNASGEVRSRGAAVMSIYQRGGTVITVGTTDWAPA